MAYGETVLTFHGGYCCAIKHIHGLGYRPSDLTRRLPKSRAERNNDKNGWNVTTERPFFTEGAPAESKGERVDRFLEFLERKRPGGVVEVTLTGAQMQGGWPEFLAERGFKEVTKVLNSNTETWIHIFHKVMEWGRGETDDDSDFDPFAIDVEEEEEDWSEEYDPDCDCSQCVAYAERMSLNG